jgi:hypothetical protein
VPEWRALDWKAKFVIGAVILVLPAITGWQIGASEIANLELQTDLRDIASQLGPRVGLDAPSTDEDIRSAVIHKAETYDIHLEPEQITVEHTTIGKDSSLTVAVNYNAPIKLPGYSFTMHFSASSAR